MIKNYMLTLKLKSNQIIFMPLLSFCPSVCHFVLLSVRSVIINFPFVILATIVQVQLDQLK